MMKFGTNLPAWVLNNNRKAMRERFETEQGQKQNDRSEYETREIRAMEGEI